MRLFHFRAYIKPFLFISKYLKINMKIDKKNEGDQHFIETGPNFQVPATLCAVLFDQ